MFIVILAIVLFVIITSIYNRAARIGEATKPSVSDGNDQWIRYYYEMARNARAEGNDSSADEYESLARTYEALRKGGEE